MRSVKKESLLYIIVRPIITFIFKLLYRPKIIGKENIPSKGRIILAGNHTSNFDCILLMSSTKRCIHFLAKIELWKGFKKIIFSNMGLIPVNRKIKDSKPLKLAEEYLLDEKVIGIFPEGTISKQKDKLLPFKIGSVKMASETDTKIVPFAIVGEYKLFSKSLKIIFSQPIEIKKGNLDEENEKLRNIIIDVVRGVK